MELVQLGPSAFEQIVDTLRTKSNEELKLLYVKLFAEELNEEWRNIAKEADFKEATEEDIVKAIQKSRYPS